MEKTSPPQLFDKKRKEALEARALRIADSSADFLCREAANAIAGRLDATNREFENTIDLFSPFDCMSEPLKASSKTKEIFSVASKPVSFATKQNPKSYPHVAAERDLLAIKPRSANLITSVFGLHWCNDLPGIFAQIKNALVEDGLFLAVLPGDRTLKELRECLLKAESELSDTVSLRIDPFGEVRQIGGLLQRTGFALPVIDTDVLTVRYHNLKDLIEDLRAMGATSALSRKPGFGPRGLFHKTEEIYREFYGDPDGKIRATFEIIHVSGWAPHASQQKPLKPGSAKNKLSDFL